MGHEEGDDLGLPETLRGQDGVDEVPVGDLVEVHHFNEVLDDIPELRHLEALLPDVAEAPVPYGFEELQLVVELEVLLHQHLPNDVPLESQKALTGDDLVGVLRDDLPALVAHVVQTLLGQHQQVEQVGLHLLGGGLEVVDEAFEIIEALDPEAGESPPLARAKQFERHLDIRAVDAVSVNVPEEGGDGGGYFVEGFMGLSLDWFHNGCC